MQLTLWKIDETGKPYRGEKNMAESIAMLERSIQETSIRKKKKNKFDASYKIESELSYKKANFF